MSSLDETTNKSKGEHETPKKRKEVIKSQVNVKENELNSLSKEAPVGILRLDVGKQRKQTGKQLIVQGEPPSPQPSVDRLSVTFAESYSFFNGENSNQFCFSPKNLIKMDHSTLPDNNDSDEEDYSASANAIIQRKASTRKSKRRNSRRPSSPFSPDILPGVEVSRRTSVYTTSSGDTAITVDSLTQELTQAKIFENIKLHKEVLSNVKMQPWNMRKKLKLVMQAKSYVKKHEGALQERFTQTYSIKNILARWNIYFVTNWQHYRREIMNLSTWMIPWERRIKQIESHFGSVVASYFIFLRWLFWVNVVTSGVLIAFIAVPEMIIRSAKDDPGRKLILPEDKYNSTNLLTLWDFDGVIKYTPIFYGWYTNKEFGTGYRLPLAYFMTQLVVYVYSFVATLRKMAENSRMSKLSEKGDECIFSWKLFTGWDFMIGNPETAQNRVMSIVMSFKEALLEEAEKKRNERNWKIIWIRIFVNLAILGLFALSAAAVVVIVKRSTEPEGNETFWRRNETAVVMSLISFLFPMILEILGFMERYHPRKQLRVQLARIMLLNLLNIYSLVFAQFDRIDGMTDELSKFKPQNVTASPVDPFISKNTELILPTIPFEEVTSLENCTKICFDTVTQSNTFNITHLISLITTSVATTALPIFLSSLESSSSVNYSYTPQTFYENQTLESNFSVLNWNDTDCCNESSLWNNSIDYQLFNNMTSNESYELLISNFADTFQDYLRYVLEHVSDGNSSNLNDSLDLSTTEMAFNLTTENYNFTDSDYDYFKATLLPILNVSVSEDSNSTFDHQLSTFYDEIKSTIATTTDEYWDPHQTCEIRCEKITPFVERKYYLLNDTVDTSNWSYQNLTKLRSLCWETMFGQEIVKLTVMDFIFTVVGAVGMDFIRGVFVRIMNNCWCWDLEKKFPEYAEFKVAENILHLVNNQGMVWMGMFFSPGIVLINVIKLMLLMYLRSWTVLTCNVPHSVIFRASRSNNFYFALLLTMLFLCVLPVGYAIVWVQPSWHCGPFSKYKRIFNIFTTTIRQLVPPKLHKPLDYIVSPGIVIPILVLLILVIYYLISLTNSLREANTDLKIQLRQERTEERRKMFQEANRQRRTGSGGLADTDNTPFNKWKKLLGNLPSGKSTDDTSKGMPTCEVENPKPEVIKPDLRKTKAIFSKFIRRALRKPSLTSEEESSPNQDDATDTEQPDSLPDDVNMNIPKERKRSQRSKRNSLYTLSSEINQPEGIRKDSIDSHEGKHVQIFEKPQLAKKSSFDIVNEERKNKMQNYSQPPSITSIEKKLDLVTSNWPDKLPIITVSKTQSSECIVKHYQEYLPASSSEGKDKESEVEDEFKPKVKYVLRKQSEVLERDVDDRLNVKENNEELSEESEDLSIKTVKCVIIDVVQLADSRADKSGENI